MMNCLRITRSICAPGLGAALALWCAFAAFAKPVHSGPDLMKSEQPMQACLVDSKFLCPKAKPGSPKLHACLERNIDKLSDACAAKLRAEKGGGAGN